MLHILKKRKKSIFGFWWCYGAGVLVVQSFGATRCLHLCRKRPFSWNRARRGFLKTKKYIIRMVCIPSQYRPVCCVVHEGSSLTSQLEEEMGGEEMGRGGLKCGGFCFYDRRVPCRNGDPSKKLYMSQVQVWERVSHCLSKFLLQEAKKLWILLLLANFTKYSHFCSARKIKTQVAKNLVLKGGFECTYRLHM